jgi:FlaA1/EpsC-like NDP-sugar epimerase
VIFHDHSRGLPIGSEAGAMGNEAKSIFLIWAPVKIIDLARKMIKLADLSLIRTS